MRTLQRGHRLTTFMDAGTYQCTAVALNVINACRVGLTLTARTALLVGAVKDFEVVAINSVADKDIGN
jgi:hypothetical protein